MYFVLVPSIYPGRSIAEINIWFTLRTHSVACLVIQRFKFHDIFDIFVAVNQDIPKPLNSEFP